MVGHVSALLLLSALCHCLQFENVSEQVRADTTPAGGGLQQRMLESD